MHFVTLDVLTEAAFGVLPAFVAAHRNATAPATRWDQWLLLNAGAVAYVLLGVSLVAATWETGAMVLTALRRSEQPASPIS